LINFEKLNDLLLHCFVANLLQNPMFDEATAHNKRKVKEKKDELVMQLVF